MDCVCHGEPMLWKPDQRYRAGGFWKCRIKDRDASRAWYANKTNRDRHLQRQRDRYDADPVFRIEKQMSNAARLRANTLKRRREHLGSLPE